jgi:hypothetical protein
MFLTGEVYGVDDGDWRADTGSMTETATMVPADLKRETMKNLRVVVRNLVKIRQLTGMAELVTLGLYLSEAGLQEVPTAADPRYMAAVERGAAVRQRLTEAEGGSLAAEEAAKTLGMSKVAVLKRYQKGKLLAWREERQHAVRFPRWQFHEGKVLEGLEKVLARLNSTCRLDDFGRLLFFLSDSRFLGGKRPLDCLREGELHKVLQAAEGYAA